MKISVALVSAGLSLVLLNADDYPSASIKNGDVKADPEHGNRLSAAIPGGDGSVRLTIGTADGRELITAETTPK